MTSISFVIPAYNAQDFISRCLDSIFSCESKYKYEVIVVNDGSTDKTYETVNKYKEKYDNLSIVNTNHVGAQNARITGLEYAKYQLVYFVDSDDKMASSFVDNVCELYEKEKYDILLINSYFGKTNSVLVDDKYFEYIKNESALKEAVFHGKFGYNCCRVYALSYLRKFKFDDSLSITYGEDLLFYLSLLNRNEAKVLTLNKCLYYYYCDDRKLADVFSEKKFFDAIFVLQHRLELALEKFPDDINLFKKTNFQVALDWIMSLWKTKNISSKEKKIIFKKAKQDKTLDFMLGKSNVSLKSINFKNKIKYYLYWVCK